MTDDKLYTSLSANTIMAKLTTDQFQRTGHITSSPDKHYSLDSEDDFRSGCRNVSNQQQFFSEHCSSRELCSPFKAIFSLTISYQCLFLFNIRELFECFFNHIISVLCQKVQFLHFANIFASFCLKIMVF